MRGPRCLGRVAPGLSQGRDGRDTAGPAVSHGDVMIAVTVGAGRGGDVQGDSSGVRDSVVNQLLAKVMPSVRA